MNLSESKLIDVEFKDVITSVKHTNIIIITIFVYYM